MVVFKMRDSVPSPRYSPVCNVLRQWKTSLIPTYRVYRLYGTSCIVFGGGGLKRRGSLCSPNKLIMRILQHYTVSEIIFTTRWGSLVTNARININVLSNLHPYGARWGSGDLQLHRVNCYMPPSLGHN